jgi:hypothetical protein
MSREAVDKFLESQIELISYTQNPTQQKQLNDRNQHISLNINPKC